METTKKLLKNIALKLTRAMVFGVLICLSLKTNAQCSAGYTFTVNPLNNGEVTYSNTSIGALYYYWDFGDGTYSNAINPGVHPYTSTGTYTTCLTIYDSLGMFDSLLGCFNNYCSTINVINSTATCNASFITNDTLGYTTITNTSTGGITNYFWNFGDGTTSTLANPGIHTYTAAGFYTICLTASNPGTLCNSTYCTNVFISSCSASYTNVPDATGNGCSFFGSTTGTGSNYFWDFGDGSTSVLQNPYHLFPSNGTYHVCLTTTSLLDTICNATACNYVSVGGICNAIFSIHQDSLNLFNYSVINSSSVSGTASYFWDFGDGTTSTLAYPSHTYADTIPVQLCLTVSSGLGCSDTFCDSILTPGRSGTPFTINVVNPLNVNEEIPPISLLENYPNPFSDNTTIHYAISKEATVSISILDLLGNTVAQIENANKSSGEYSIVWNSQGVSEGMYLLQLKVNNTTQTKKIVVSK